LGFVFRGQTTAEAADLDHRALRIVIRRDINLDVSRVGDRLPSGDSGTTNDDEQRNLIELHFGLTSRKLSHRSTRRKCLGSRADNEKCIYPGNLIEQKMCEDRLAQTSAHLPGSWAAGDSCLLP